MSDDAGFLRDRVKLVGLLGDIQRFNAADALWNECASGQVRADACELTLVVMQIEESLGRLVDERDFLARALRDLGEKELEARIFANQGGRLTGQEVTRLRTIVTEHGTITDTLVGIVAALPTMYSSRIRRVRSTFDRICAGDESIFAERAASSCCDAAGVGLAIAVFGSPLHWAIAGTEAIICC